MSFSDAEGEIAVVEFTILDAHDAAMALSLVRAALALTKHASAVVGVVAVHGERGGTALAYLEKSEAAELFARRWDGAALRSEPERAAAAARCATTSLADELARVARGGLAPASVALAPWENGSDAPAWRLALHVALAVRSRLDGVAAAVDREDREAALHAFHERAHPAAGRRGWDAPTPAKFDREREKWSLDAAGPPPLAVDANGAGWQHCYAVAKVRLSRSDWLALHEARARHGAAAEDGEDLAALTDPAGNRWTVYAQAIEPSLAAAGGGRGTGGRAAARGAVGAAAARDAAAPGAREASAGGSALAVFVRADFGAGRPFGAAIEAKLGVHAVRHDGSRLHGCRGAAELPQTRELLRHELAPASNLAYDTLGCVVIDHVAPARRARDADQEALDAAAEAARLALVDDAAALVAARRGGGGGDAARLWAALDGRAADCRRLAAVAAASAADRARADAARRSSLRAPWATALDDVFGPNGSLIARQQAALVIARWKKSRRWKHHGARTRVHRSV